MILTKDKYFYKTALNIALPIAIQNLITFSVSMADTVMLGNLGELSLSASSIGNHLGFFLMVLMFGVGGGASVMASQYYGQKDVDSIHKVIAIMYRVCIILSVFFALIAIITPKLFMNIYTNDIEVINEGVLYIRIIGISYIFYSITNCTISILRSVKTVRISLLVYSISLIINIFFNYILIFGKLGFPVLGIRGAAIATVISRIAEFLIVLIFIIYFEKKIHLRFKDITVIDKDMISNFKKVCTPIILNELFWAIGSTIISIIVGRMGRVVVAANSINNVTFQFASLFVFGLASASSVIIGNIIGEGKYEKAKEYASTICILSFAMGILSGLTIYLVRPIVVNFYNVSQSTKVIAMQIMIATSIIAIFKSLTSNIMMGVLRGGGDNKFVFKVEMIFLWCISIPLGLLSAFVFKLPIFVIFIAIKIDEVLKALVGILRLKSGKWIKDFTRGYK
ncbi:MAG: MATE family efflux transporter [Peptostreptococcaceae bacterium]